MGGSAVHAAYYQVASQQYFSSAFAEPYRSSPKRMKALYRGYARCRQLLSNAKLPSQICMATDHECFYVWLTAEFQMYLVVVRGTSTGVIGQFYQWVKSQEKNIFV